MYSDMQHENRSLGSRNTERRVKISIKVESNEDYKGLKELETRRSVVAFSKTILLEQWGQNLGCSD